MVVNSYPHTFSIFLPVDFKSKGPLRDSEGISGLSGDYRGSQFKIMIVLALWSSVMTFRLLLLVTLLVAVCSEGLVDSVEAFCYHCYSPRARVEPQKGPTRKKSATTSSSCRCPNPARATPVPTTGALLAGFCLQGITREMGISEHFIGVARNLAMKCTVAWRFKGSYNKEGCKYSK